MSNVAVEKIRNPEASPPSLIEEMIAIADKIQKRAYEIFQRRGGSDGHSLDDWLQAERDIVQSPEAELIEKDGKFRIRVAAAGFDANDIHVTAMQGGLIVQAETKHEHEKSEGDIHFCEFGRRQLFRRLDLPAPINPDKVTAKLEHGVLELTAEKSVDVANKVKALAAA